MTNFEKELTAVADEFTKGTLRGDKFVVDWHAVQWLFDLATRIEDEEFQRAHEADEEVRS